MVTGSERMGRRVLLAAVVLLSVVAVASVDARRSKRYDCSKKLAKAIQRYERGRYNDAKTILDDVQFQCGGHQVMDTALYYLGMALLRGNSPIDGKSAFRRLVSNYPDSPFAEESRFRMGQCSWRQSNTYDRDQTETKEAIRELRDFLEAYGGSTWADSARECLRECHDKLAQKEYANARFYHRIDKYDAAVVYYRAVIDDYPESSYAAESRLYLAQALHRINRTTEARDVIGDILDGPYEQEIKRRARLLQSRLDEEE
jgi:outer membrane protein assembly factor BamD